MANEPERVSIVVHPSLAHEDAMSVEDAMHQVLDAISLLDDSNEIVWKLVSATTNSPLQVVAEAVSRDRNFDVGLLARDQAQRLSYDLPALLEGHVPEGWSRGKIAAGNRLLARTRNGIGCTEFILANTPVIIDASRLQPELSRAGTVDDYVKHNERGSIEGKLIDITTYNGKPAIFVEERKSKKRVVCIISQETLDEIGATIRTRDVWEHRRLSVRGTIIFSGPGKIRVIESDSVRFIQPSRRVEVRDIHDTSFTDGLSITDYLAGLRDGELG